METRGQLKEGLKGHSRMFESLPVDNREAPLCFRREEVWFCLLYREEIGLRQFFRQNSVQHGSMSKRIMS